MRRSGNACAAGCRPCTTLGHIQTEPAAALLGLALAYPLWSWLRLRSATHFLALELQDLQGQGLPISNANVLTGDVLDQRIAAVEQASRQLRSLHHFVSESLRQLPSATFVCDRNGRVLLANTAAHAYISSLGTTLQTGDDLVSLLTNLSSAEPAASPSGQPAKRTRCCSDPRCCNPACPGKAKAEMLRAAI